MYFKLLGPLEVANGGGLVTIGSGKRRSLLAVLLLHPNQVVSAERLIDYLWGERPPATSAKSVQVHVSRLRRELQQDGAGGGELLMTRSNGYLLRIGRDDLDILCFERLLAEGERALSAGEARHATVKLGEALALWEGPALADFAYEPFAQEEIGRLEELRLVALGERIEADLALGRHEQVTGELEALVREHPLRERLRGLLMLALYRCGRHAEALESYRQGARMLRDELGLEPGPALRELESKVLEHSSDLAAPATEPMPEQASSTPQQLAPPVPRRRRRRAWMLFVAAGVLLAAAVTAAVVRSGDGPPVSATPALDLAPNSIAALGAGSGKPQFVVPLPGRPVDLAVSPGLVYAVTVDSASLTTLDARTRKVVGAVPLGGRPGGVAVGFGAVWVVDATRGRVVRFEPGYERPTAQIRYDRGASAASGLGRFQLDSSAVTAGGGAVWVTDGSRRLLRVDPRTEAVTSITTRVPLDGVTAGAGAVWGFSARAATVVRVDPRRGVVTDHVRVARPGSQAPFPIGIAATADAVWVLNGNTATISRIDPETRGLTATVTIGVDRVPRHITASGRTVWVANYDGTLSRIDPGRDRAVSQWVGESLTVVAADAARVWVTTAALDQQLPGGAG